MVPLAVSGTIIVAAAVSVAGVLIYVLLRGEERFDQQERRAQEQQAAPEPHEPEAQPPAPSGP